MKSKYRILQEGDDYYVQHRWKFLWLLTTPIWVYETQGGGDWECIFPFKTKKEAEDLIKKLENDKIKIIHEP